MRKPKHKGKRVSPGHRGHRGGVTLHLVHCTPPADAAFLAREKAKADAECYTAMKIAEANKVRPKAAREGKMYLGLGQCHMRVTRGG